MNDDRDLEGLRALVTGATSGIGMAAAQQLARHAAEVIVRGTAVANAINADGGKAASPRLISAGRRGRRCGPAADPVDILFNNAGGGLDRSHRGARHGHLRSALRHLDRPGRCPGAS